jgi:Ni,Fe-hydrogenase III small subunit
MRALLLAVVLSSCACSGYIVGPRAYCFPKSGVCALVDDGRRIERTCKSVAKKNGQTLLTDRGNIVGADMEVRGCADRPNRVIYLERRPGMLNTLWHEVCHLLHEDPKDCARPEEDR